MAPPKRAQNPSTMPPPKRAPARPTPASAAVSSQNPLVVLANHYLATTPQRTKLIDAFMGFLIVTGVLQFMYCIVAGNYPFNAFLAGFSATVGQFVLVASLRIQGNPKNKEVFASVSQERAFADFIFGSLILHFFCINFIN